MSKARKKLMASILAASMAATLFAGCGNSGTKSGSTDGGTGTKQVKEEVKPVLKVILQYFKDDPNTYPVAKDIEAKTGYKVEYSQLPQDKPNDKLNLIFASGEEYDVISMAPDKLLYGDYAKKGAIIPLDSLIEKFGANIKSSVSQQSFTTFKVDNKVYCIPNLKMPARGVGSAIAVRQDWLDKLGLKIPKTLDEFVEVLKAFKEKDPAGNGDKNIALTMTGSYLVGVRGAFGMPNGWNDVNGKLVNVVEDKNYKDYLTFLNGLYKNGLLDKEFPTNKQATVDEKFSSGRAGMMPVHWANVPTLYDALNKTNPNAKVSFIAPLIGKDGKQGVPEEVGYDRITVIPAASKNPEHAMKWLNAKLDKEAHKVIAIGEEGKLHTYKDGKYSPILPIFFDQRGNAHNYLSGVDEKLYPEYWQARLKKDMRLYDAYTAIQADALDKSAKLDVTAFAPAFPESSKYSQELAQMSSDFEVKVIAGAEPITAVDAFIAKWKAAGGEATSKDLNAWYPTFKK